MDNKIIPAVVIVALLLVGGIMLFSGNEPEPEPVPEPEPDAELPDVLEGFVELHTFKYAFAHEICYKKSFEDPKICVLSDFTKDDVNSITVKVGTMVTWIQEDALGAGGDANYHNVVEINGAFSSNQLVKGGKFKFMFETVGEYEYFCEPHQFMKGKITVVE